MTKKLQPDELTIAYMSGVYDGKKRWVDLTDEEMQQLNDTLNLQGRYPIIKAIAAKLKEKNT
jgi:hypothetical protein